jgi:TRAP transporter TAXI family solute receptor
MARIVLALIACALAGTAAAQTLGFATLPTGTLNYTTASAIAKVMTEKGGMNMLVQPTAGDVAIIPMVGRNEAAIGITNALELAAAVKSGAQPNVRILGAAHALRTAFFVRKDSPMRTIADLKGKRVVLGYSAMRTIQPVSLAILATGGLSEADVKPVLVPNVVRGADDFGAGAADMFFFAFGAPKVREVDATVGGIRALEIPEAGMAAAKKIVPEGYLTQAAPVPFFIGVEKPMGVYSWDNMIFTSSKVSDDVVYKLIDTLEQNKADLISIQPALREFSPAALYTNYPIPYHPGALKYFKEHNIQAKALR